MMSPKSSLRIMACATLLCAGSHLLWAASEGKFERSLEVNGAVSLEIETGSGNIDVHTGSSNKVQVIGWIKAHNGWDNKADDKVRELEQHPPIVQNGNEIRLGHIEDSELRRHISINFEVTVPADTRVRAHSGSGNATVDGTQGMLDVGSGSGGLKISNIGDTVHAETGSGNIDVSNVKGSLRVKTGSGSIQARGVAGGFEGTTGSGNISLDQTAAGAVRAETGSGVINLHSVRGSLEAKTGSGGIRADGDPTGAWNLQTGSGTVNLRIPQDASFDLDAHTSSGSVSVNHPLTMQGNISKKEVHGKVRSGGVPIDVSTGSGNIDIE